MKYILILALSVFLLSCTRECPELPNAERAAYVPQMGTYIYKVTIEGHDYLCGYHVGVIHSESCKSPEHYDTK